MSPSTPAGQQGTSSPYPHRASCPLTMPGLLLANSSKTHHQEGTKLPNQSRQPQAHRATALQKAEEQAQSALGRAMGRG